MAYAGWAPAITECARCATPGPHRSFNVAAGGAVCASCRPPGSVAPSPETFALLDALLHGDWPIADAAGPPPAGRPPAWSPRTCSGTWSAGCARCRWWSGERRRATARSAAAAGAHGALTATAA